MTSLTLRVSMACLARVKRESALVPPFWDDPESCEADLDPVFDRSAFSGSDTIRRMADFPARPKWSGLPVKTSTSQPATVSSTMRHRLGAIDVLLLSAWCGLAAGELEVGARVISRSLSSTDRLYQMTRHFVWLVPSIDLMLFLGFGLFLAVATRLWPRRAGWLSPRLILAWAVLPALLVAGRGIYTEAWLIVALGFASFVTPVLERNPAGMRRCLTLSLPLLLSAIVLQASLLFGGDRLKQWREDARPLPPAGSPNVLLIVLDTVRADHLSVYGYERPTSPNLERLAARAHPLRTGSRRGPLDAGLARHHVHRSLAA